MNRSKLYIIISIVVLAGLSLSLGIFTFIYGKGASYLSDDPKACMNCHVMRDQYGSWQASSHHKVTTCNSCHSPENFYLKYFFKAENGFNHSLKFTTGKYSDPIRIRKHNFDITMKACLKCHGSIFTNSAHKEDLDEGRSCVHCHKDIGHTH